MASTATTSLLLEKQGPEDNPGTWGDRLNTGLDMLDRAVAGILTIPNVGGTVILTDTQFVSDNAKSAVLDCTATLTSNLIIEVPIRSKIYGVRNGTSGAFTVTVKTNTGTGVIIPQGTACFIIVDPVADDVDFLTTPTSPTAGVLPISGGGTSATTAAGARTALDLYSTGETDAAIAAAITLEDLDFSADSGGSLSIDLDSEALTLSGGTGIATVGALNDVTFNVTGVLEDLDTLGAATIADQFLVSTAAGVVAWESGATARTSLDVYSVAEADSAIAAAITAEDLDFDTDTASPSSVDLNSQTLSILGVTGVAVTHAAQTISISTVDSEIVHDNLSGFLANEHIDWTAGTANSIAIATNEGVTIGSATLTNGANEFQLNTSAHFSTTGLFAVGTTPVNLYAIKVDAVDERGFYVEQSLATTTDYSFIEGILTWNTTGTPTAILVDVTDTASNAASLLQDLQVGSVSQFSVSKGGNVALTGTVDGRDVATDGTKLDGIEDNATADQTTEEIVDAAWNATLLAGTQTGITVTYQDGTDDVDFVTDVTLTGSEVLTNKTISSASNTLTVDLGTASVTGSIAEFDAALQADTFVFTSEVGSVVQAHSAVLDATTASFLTADETKLDFITVTQAVDLDAIETRVNALDAAVILMGTWDASVGTFPGGATAQAGESWIVSVGGTVDSVVFVADDRIIAITDNASTTVFAANWHKADYTDLVQSVAGKTGAVVLAAADIASGTFVDARIAESNVTQHEAAINHDALTGFVGDEHVAHGSVTFTAGTGLTGGGTIAANRTFDIDSTVVTLTGTQTLENKTFTNLTDNASVLIATLEGNRATPANGDEAYLALVMSDTVGNQDEMARITWEATTATTAAEVGSLIFGVSAAGVNTNELTLNATSLSPFANDGLALGTTALGYSDLHLANEGIINWNNGDFTISENFFGGEVDAPTGKQFRIGFNGTTNYQFNETGLLPLSDNDRNLGGGSQQWAQLYLGAGGDINWNGGAQSISQFPAGGTGFMSYFGATHIYEHDGGSTATVEVMRFIHDFDNASVHVASFWGERPTETAGDEAYITFKLKDSINNQDEYARITWEATSITSTAEVGKMFFGVGAANVNTNYLALAAGELTPFANDATALGSTTLGFADLYLATTGRVLINNVDTLNATALNAAVQVPTGSLNSGTGASATTFWRGDGTWVVPAGSGDVSKVGVPVDNQIGVWTGDGTIEGTTKFVWDDTSSTLDLGDNTIIDFGLGGVTVTHAAASDSLTIAADPGNVTGSSQINFAVDGTSLVSILPNAITPFTTNGAALGGTTLQWSDIFVAAGAVANWNNGAATITEASGLLSVTGWDMTEEVQFSGDISPAQITANQNNWNPSGQASASRIYIDADAARNITGLAGGTAGRVVMITNDGTFDITFPHEDVLSTAANRFELSGNGDIILSENATIFFQYDENASRWRNVGGSGGMSFSSQSAAPTSPQEGDIWFDTDTGVTAQYVDDGTTLQWVEINTGAGITYTEATTAPSTPVAGDQWWDTDANIMFFYSAAAQAWVEYSSAIGGTIPAMVLLDSGVVSGSVSELDIDISTFTDYEVVRIIYSGFAVTTDGAAVWLRVSEDGGTTFEAAAADYVWAAMWLWTGGVAVSDAESTGDTEIHLGESVDNGAGATFSCELTVHNWQSNTNRTQMQYTSMHTDTSGVSTLKVFNGSAMRLSTVDTTDIRLLPSGGNFDEGIWAVYGMAGT